MAAVSPRIILITGGSRSGKSRLALSIAAGENPKFFVATAQPRDEEMRSRIKRHQQERSGEWITVEEPLNLNHPLQQYRSGVIVIDCLTLWISNLLEQNCDELEVVRRVEDVIAASRQRNGSTIFVTNEVGMGIIPGNKLARKFRDLSGLTNQQIAMAADRVILMISGLPMELKKQT